MDDAFNVTHVPSAGYDSDEYVFVTLESSTSSRACGDSGRLPETLRRTNAFKDRQGRRTKTVR